MVRVRPHDRIQKGQQKSSPFHHTDPILELVSNLPYSSRRANFLFLLRQEPRLERCIREEKECHSRHANCGKAFDQEKHPPWCDAWMTRGDPVGQSSGKAGRQRSGRKEQTNPKTDLVAKVEKGQVVGHSWTKPSFKRPEEKANSHES